MKLNLYSEAQELATRQYQVQIILDETTDGEPCYVATVPELPICMSDGVTVEEARQNIQSAMVDYIYFMLEDGLPVPEPRAFTQVAIDLQHYWGESNSPAAVVLNTDLTPA